MRSCPFISLRIILVFIFSIFPARMRAEVPPNVVLIISDDQAWTDYGFMGHETIRTPNLDRLAKEGAVFTRGYVPGSLCRCSLATIVTGLYPHQHGITSNDPPPGQDRHGMLKYIEGAQTLPKLLGAAGYESLQTGKWWEGNYQLGGFTRGMTDGDPARGGRHGDEGLKIGRAGLKPIRDFVDSLNGKPFLIWYAPMMPHLPHDPPERILERYRQPGRPEQISRYWAMCEWFDESVGELLGLLDEKGLANGTLVAFLADNGWIQLEESPDFAPRSKRSPYDGGLRTPIILRWPGRIAPRRDDHTLVLSLDLAPTILSACGLPPRPQLPGIDLLKLQPEERVNPRTTIFGEVFSHSAVDLDRPGSSLLYRWCIHEDWKLILPRDEAEKPELYQIMSDPREMRDLAVSEPERAQVMEVLIEKWWDGR